MTSIGFHRYIMYLAVLAVSFLIFSNDDMNSTFWHPRPTVSGGNGLEGKNAEPSAGAGQGHTGFEGAGIHWLPVPLKSHIKLANGNPEGA